MVPHLTTVFTYFCCIKNVILLYNMSMIITDPINSREKNIYIYMYRGPGNPGGL